MRNLCQQTILMKYDALLLFLKNGKFENCRLLQIIGGTLWVMFEQSSPMFTIL